MKRKLQEFFKNKNHRNILIVVLFSIFVALPVVSISAVKGHDSIFHESRFIGTVNALKDGQLLPQVDPDALEGIGYGANIFYGPLPAYIATVFKAIVIDWTVAYNLTVLVSFICIGLTMYACAKRVFSSETIGLISALVYVSAPYVLTDIFVRAAIGEFFGFIFFPLVFLGFWNILKGKKWGSILLGVSGAGLLLVHNLSAAIVLIGMLLFFIFYFKQFFAGDKILKLIAGAAIALGLSAFFWLPMLEARSATTYNVFDGTMATIEGVSSSSIPIFQTMFPINDGMSFAIGLVAIVCIVLLYVYRVKIDKKHKKLITACLVISAVALVCSSNLFPWYYMPEPFAIIQFPWRFSILSTFFICLISGYALTLGRGMFKDSRTALVAFCLLLFVGMNFFTAYKQLPKFNAANPSRVEYHYAEGYTDHGLNDYLPVALDNHKSGKDGNTLIVENTPTILSGNATIDDYYREGTHIGLNAVSTVDTDIELPLTYYPGYIIGIDDEYKYAKPSPNGLVLLSFPAGFDGVVSVRYALSPSTKIGLVISSLTILTLAIFIVNRRVKTS